MLGTELYPLQDADLAAQVSQSGLSSYLVCVTGATSHGGMTNGGEAQLTVREGFLTPSRLSEQGFSSSLTSERVEAVWVLIT